MPSPKNSVITVRLPYDRSYGVRFGAISDAPRLCSELQLRAGQALVITDENVEAYYLAALADSLTTVGWTVRSHVISVGESSKAPQTLEQLYDWALSETIDRQTPVFALGGGVVGDLAGFLAATLLRGLPLVHVPTSLIAQADSSIGGKTGINHVSGKNLIGAFYQPRFVLTDVSTLTTLPNRDYMSGLAEVVKHALIADASFFDWLLNAWDQILLKTAKSVQEMVYRAATIKANIVSEDEREVGKRKLLNFGHTFGHALERVAGYGTLSHGEAIAVGMRAALHLSASVQAGKIWSGALPSSFERAEALVGRIPVAASLSGIPIDVLVDAMQTDKKRVGHQLQFVLLSSIGEAFVAEAIPSGSAQAAWEHALSFSPAE